MLMTPALRILIWGLPTFHLMATLSIFKNTLVLYYLSASLIWALVSISSSSTKVSIRISMSQSRVMQYSSTVSISLKYRMAYPSQFLTMVSNLKRLLLVLLHWVYSFFSMILASTGPTSRECSSGTEE